MKRAGVGDTQVQVGRLQEELKKKEWTARERNFKKAGQKQRPRRLPVPAVSDGNPAEEKQGAAAGYAASDHIFTTQ